MKDINITPRMMEGYRDNLKGRVFKLLPLREEKQQWEKYLDTILVELAGVYEENESINYLRLMLKLNALRIVDFSIYRKTIFECLDIISHLDL